MVVFCQEHLPAPDTLHAWLHLLFPFYSLKLTWTLWWAFWGFTSGRQFNAYNYLASSLLRFFVSQLELVLVYLIFSWYLWVFNDMGRFIFACSITFPPWTLTCVKLLGLLEALNSSSLILEIRFMVFFSRKGQGLEAANYCPSFIRRTTQSIYVFIAPITLLLGHYSLCFNHGTILMPGSCGVWTLQTGCNRRHGPKLSPYVYYTGFLLVYLWISRVLELRFLQPCLPFSGCFQTVSHCWFLVVLSWSLIF